MKKITAAVRKCFGSLNLTWPVIIAAAVITGAYTAVMALLPAARDTSFADISISFEWWILFGILIIVNSKTPWESALKCFVFFLISQPIVYLIQVPFSRLGWGIFVYYPQWFAFTLLTFPMGFAGYYLRKEKWWSMLILGPILVMLGYHYYGFFRETISFFPNHLLSAIFCVATMLIYPVFIFSDKRLKIAGLALSGVLIAAATVAVLAGGRTAYETTILTSGGQHGVEYDDSYSVSLEDEAFGEVEIVYLDGIECYAVKARFTKTGDTKLILEAPDGSRRYFALTVGRDTYKIEEITDAGG